MAQAAIPAGDVGQWVFLAGVYDGGQWDLYRDGVAISTSGTTSQGAALLSHRGRLEHRCRQLVVNGEGGTGRYFEGQIDDVSIWDTGLSASSESGRTWPRPARPRARPAWSPTTRSTRGPAERPPVDATSNGNTGTLGGINPRGTPDPGRGHHPRPPSVMISPEASVHR